VPRRVLASARVRHAAAVAAALVTVASSAAAQAQVSPPAPDRLAIGDWQLAPVVEARVRGEYRHDLDGQDRGILTERVRLGADVERGPLEARVVLQDARLWDLGGASDFIGQPGQFALTGAYEAWAEGHTSGVRPSFLRVGRQPITWGEGRLLGVADWSPTGRTLDAVRGRLVAGDWAFELLAAVLSDAIPPPGALVGSAYGELFGARAEWAIDPLFAVDVYALARLAQDTSATSVDDTVRGQTYTGAVRLHGGASAWTWGAEGAYQLGYVDSLQEHRAAWASAGHVGYAFEHTLLRPTVRVGVSYATGDHGGSTYRGFDPLLPDVHTWHGAMDLFSWSNEEEASLRVTAAPWTDGIVAVEYRYAQLAQTEGAWHSASLDTIASPLPSNTASSLGHEIDASVRWSPWAPVELSAGYSVAALGDGAKALLAAQLQGSSLSPPSLAHFAYAQASVQVP
jgi:Alginate export